TFDRVRSATRNVRRNAGALRDATVIKNARVLRSLLGPALRGFVLQRAKGRRSASIPTEYAACFNFEYTGDRPRLRRLSSQAKRDQWDGETAPDWATPVDPQRPDVELLQDRMLPLHGWEGFARLSPQQKREQKRGMLSWLLSQI